MRPIYLSHRPQDEAVAERIVTRALQSYGPYSVTRHPLKNKPDSEPIERHVETIMIGCRKAIILIGQEWAGLDQYGRFRLSTADVPIYAELRAVLKDDLDVLVVLIDDAELPPIAQIPEEFHGFLSLPVVRLREAHFNADLNAIIPPPTFSRMVRYWLSLDWFKVPSRA